MEADETLIAAELVLGGSRGSQRCRRAGGTVRWPAHCLLSVGFGEHDLTSPVLWQMFTGRQGKTTGAIRIHRIHGLIFQLTLKNQINKNVLIS